MSFSKVIQLGTIGQLTLGETAGAVQLQIGVADSAGGGSVAGVAKVSANVSAEISIAELIDAGLALAEAKFPALSSEIAVLKGLVDAAIAKA